MSPALVSPKPHGVRAGAQGSFSASFWRFRAGWHSVRFRLTTSRLTGRAITAHIHTGAPGRNGPVLVTLCDPGRCELVGGVRIVPSATAESWVEAMSLLGAYVDVHTKRNPRGELRGQIVITP
jgi:CHRD domain